jgi:streptogramin lyase
MSSASALGTSSTNVAGLTRAFASVHKLVNTTTGTAPGDLLPTGAIAPTVEINTLADLIAVCVNTTGDTGSGTPCHQLFTLVTPAGGTAPTDTVGAALAIAKNPTLNVASLFKLLPASNPFQPILTAAPTDWTLAINYTGSFNKPATTSIDSSGNIWVANSGNNTVAVLAQTGSPAVSTPLLGNGLATPASIAIDTSGNAWVANSTAATLSAFTATGTPLTGSPFTSNGLSQPVSLAFDATGNLWVANSGNDSILELSSTGTPIQQISSTSAPSAIAVDPK